MSFGRTFQGNSRIYNPVATAALMEEKPSTEGASECKVWKMDIPYYEQTGIVRKLEYLREEPKPQKLTCHSDEHGRLAWDNKNMGRYGM